MTVFGVLGKWVASIAGQLNTPLFRSIPGKSGTLTGEPLNRRNAWEMVKRRAKAAGLSNRLCNHSFRPTGITAYLENGGTLDVGQPYCLLRQKCPGSLFRRFSTTERPSSQLSMAAYSERAGLEGSRALSVGEERFFRRQFGLPRMIEKPLGVHLKR